jgi:hypothetical protein
MLQDAQDQFARTFAGIDSDMSDFMTNVTNVTGVEWPDLAGGQYSDVAQAYERVGRAQQAVVQAVNKALLETQHEMHGALTGAMRIIGS